MVSDTRPPLMCGIDYSSKAIDVALVRGRELVSVETHPLGVDLAVKVGVVARVVMALAEQGVAAIIMEERWVRQEKGIATAMMIRDVSTGVLWLATAASLKVSFVPINRWHAVILGNGGLKSDQGKRESKLYVERVYSKNLTADQADAACLATYGASVVGLELARQANGGRAR